MRKGAEMSPSEQREPTVEKIIAGVTSYYRGEHQLYVRHSEPLDAALRAAIARYFPAQLLNKVKTITLRGARIPPPPFYARAKEMSGGNFPDFVHLASFTYIDVLVFHDEIAPRALFHALVHATQMELLGFERYVALYVRGFLKHRSWLAIPLEQQTYKLEARFAESSVDIFSVEDEIKTWDEEGRYL
jgi:hypothetical protein